MTDPRMTSTNDAPVTVEQCDRERAGDLYERAHTFDPCCPPKTVDRKMREGKLDDGQYVQDFARHRLAALASAPAGVEPFGYWIEQKNAEPALLRKPAYIPEPSDLRTVTPLYAAPVTVPVGLDARTLALEPASAPAELSFLRQFYDDWRTGKPDSHLREASEAFEDAGGAIAEPAAAPVGDGVEAERLIREAASLIKPGEGEAVFYIRVGGEHTQMQVKAAKGVEPSDVIDKAIACLVGEKCDLADCPAHRLAAIASAPAGDGDKAAHQFLFHAGVHESTDRAIGLIPYPIALRAVREALARPHSAVAPAGDGVEPSCTCHPDDRPSGSCERKYAASECKANWVLRTERKRADANWAEADRLRAILDQHGIDYHE